MASGSNYRDAWGSLLKQYEQYFSKIVFGCTNIPNCETATLTEDRSPTTKELTDTMKEEAAAELTSVAKQCPMYGDQNWIAEFYVDPNGEKPDVQVSALFS